MSVLKKKKSRLKTKFRVTIFNDETLQDVNTFFISKMNVLTYVGFFFVISSIITALLLIYTPLSILLPFQENTDTQRKIISNAVQIDSLQRKMNAQRFYLEKFKLILEGGTYTDTSGISKAIYNDSTSNLNELDFSTSSLDSVLRAEIESSEKSNLSVIENVSTSTSLKNLHFFMPVKGIVTNGFEPKIGHYAIDIVAGANEPILAALSGTVIFSSWTTETGYVIQIQHSNDLLTVYKHNSVLLKKSGDRVEAGETIAIIGNSGEITTGPHLHFELWHKGVPVNPEDYIAF